MFRRNFYAMIPLFAVLAGAAASPAQTQPQQPADPAAVAAQTPTIKATAEEVVLDVIVRDKKGKELRDLEPADFEVMDNGAKREVKSVRLVEGKEAIAKGASVALDPLRQIRLVSLVFEGGLDNDGRRLARQAALDLIKGNQAQNVFYAVMVVNQQLSALTPFTADREVLRAAVEKATAGGLPQVFVTESENVRKNLRALVGSPAGMNSAAQNSRFVPGGPQGPAERAAANIILNMLQWNESMSVDQSSRLSLTSLLNVARAHTVLPGRKSVIYFTWGLIVPMNLDELFRAVMSTANRANVTFYPVDTKGLTTWGENSGATSNLSEAVKASREQATSTGGAVDPRWVKAQDRAEQGMRANERNSLVELANSTGGFMIANTNDFRGPLRRINEEINTYYEISYDPGIETYDGSFRKTAVQVKRPDVKVQARAGYFALPPSEGGNILMPFEVPLLKALSTAPLPHDVEFRAAALHFQPEPDGTAHSAVVVEIPMSSLTYNFDDAKTTYKTRLSFVSLLKDSSGNVVQKWNRDVPFQGPADKVEQIKAVNFSYKEQFAVQPGRFTLETAVMDREGNKVGAKKAAFIVPPKKTGVALSNVTLVRNFQANAQGLTEDDPFQFQGGKITPSLNTTIKAGKGAIMSMFFVVYPDKTIPDKPQIILEYIKDGQVVGQGEVPLPAADAKGRIPYVMSSSAESMPPGNYEIHAVAKQGNTSAEERAFFTVE